MHKMRIWFVKMKGANVLEITLKTPLQKNLKNYCYFKNFKMKI